MPLHPAQQQTLDSWFPGASVLADLSWGQVDTVVLHLGTHLGQVVVKAAGPDNHHIGREITAHQCWTGPWLAGRRVNRLVRWDRERNLLALTYLPGALVLGTPAAGEPDTHRQAGQLLAALHGQDRRVSHDHEAAMDERALRWLDGRHRIASEVEVELRRRIAGHEQGPTELVPTHGDWQPRNWLLDGEGRLLVIDLGRAQWRPAATDLARLARQEWEGRPDLEAAFFDGYGPDPRQQDPAAWERALLREAVGTAAWAHQVGDEPFERQGHRLIHQVLAATPRQSGGSAAAPAPG